MADYPCRSYRSNSIKFLPKLQIVNGYQFKNHYFKNVLSTKPSAFVGFKESKLTVIRLLPVRAYCFATQKHGRQARFIRHLSFKNSSLSRVTISPYVSKDAIQDKDFWIISKADLARVGLVPKAENSLAELVTSLILFWDNDRLDSSRIKVIFYRHILFIDDGQCFDVQSYLIDFFNVFSSSEMKR